MIKPSEFTPATSALLVEMLAAAFPGEQVAVVTGDAAVGAAFSALAFDHLVFTGSTAVGRAVMRAASDNLVPATLGRWRPGTGAGPRAYARAQPRARRHRADGDRP
jgi:coniferyl-aldehyde dehydrogenase